MIIHQPQTYYLSFLEAVFSGYHENHMFQVKWADVLLGKKEGSTHFLNIRKKNPPLFRSKKIGKQLFINLRNLQRTNTPSLALVQTFRRSEIPLEWCKHFAKISLCCKRCTAPWPKWPANGPVRQTEGRQSQRVMTKEKHTTEVGVIARLFLIMGI